MKKAIFSAMLLSSAMLMAEGNQAAATDSNITAPQQDKKAVMMEGVKYIKVLGKALKENVGKRLKEDPTGLKAVKFCSENAKDVAKKVFADFPENVKVRRTALKFRNPHNKPDETDTKTMEDIVAAMKAGTFDKKPVVVKMPDGKTRVYAPLMVEKACTKCHGDPAKIDPKVMEVLKNKYPEDNATGFAEHDFRGVAVAEISATANKDTNSSK